MKRLLKFTMGLFVPHSLFLIWNSFRERKIKELEKRRMQDIIKSKMEDVTDRNLFSYKGAFCFLQSLGCDLAQLQLGSIPENSLQYCGRYIIDAEDSNLLRKGLVIGNFVGISLAYLTDLVTRFHPASMMVAVDPNVPHREIKNPTEKAITMLCHFGLQKNVVVLTGYSLEKNISNDGNMYTASYDPFDHYASEKSCENQLDHLSRLGPAQFDFVLIDGNHEKSYLQREIEYAYSLLKPRGLLFLDDVSASWPALRASYEQIDIQKFEKLGTDGRVGALKKN